jgi:hypothetical protein
MSTSISPEISFPSYNLIHPCAIPKDPLCEPFIELPFQYNKDFEVSTVYFCARESAIWLELAASDTAVDPEFLSDLQAMNPESSKQNKKQYLFIIIS